MFGNRPVGIDEAAIGQFPTQTPKRKGGIFGGGARNIAGVIGDMLLQASGSRPMFLPMLMQQRQAEQERAQAEAQRQQQLRDQMALIDYRAANRPEPADDVFTRTLRAAGIDPNSPEGRAMYERRARTMADPVQLIPDGFGGVTRVSKYEDGGDQAPDELPADFDFGGDGGSNAPGGFHPGF